MAYGELNDHVTSHDPEKSSHDPSNRPSMFGPIISTIADSDLFIMQLLQKIEPVVLNGYVPDTIK